MKNQVTPSTTQPTVMTTDKLTIDLNYLAKTYGIDHLLVAYVQIDDGNIKLVLEGSQRGTN